jgi:hypothetical protein
VCAGWLAASSDTNESRRPLSPPRLGVGKAGATWAMAARVVAVDSRHRERLAVAHVRRRQWESGCHELKGDTIRRWLVGGGLVLHV